MVERSWWILMLGCGLDLRAGQTKQHDAVAGADPLHRGGRDDVMRFADVMQEVDDEVALTGSIARPRDLAGLPIVASTRKPLMLSSWPIIPSGNDQGPWLFPRPDSSA